MSDAESVDAVRDVGGKPLISIVYVSSATVPFTEVDLALLLAISRSNNHSRDLTGILLYERGHFIQALEGPESAVRSTLATIAADPRHTGVWTLDERRIDGRQFGSWAMGYRTSSAEDHTSAPAWLGSPEAGRHRGESRASELLRWFRDRASADEV